MLRYYLASSIWRNENPLERNSRTFIEGREVHARVNTKLSISLYLSLSLSFSLSLPVSVSLSKYFSLSLVHTHTHTHTHTHRESHFTMINDIQYRYSLFMPQFIFIRSCLENHLPFSKSGKKRFGKLTAVNTGVSTSIILSYT